METITHGQYLDLVHILARRIDHPGDKGEAYLAKLAIDHLESRCRHCWQGGRSLAYMLRLCRNADDSDPVLLEHFEYLTLSTERCEDEFLAHTSRLSEGGTPYWWRELRREIEAKRAFVLPLGYEDECGGYVGLYEIMLDLDLPFSREPISTISWEKSLFGISDLT